MAGPNLSTSEGAKAKCLYERARTGSMDRVSGGGYIVYDC